MLPSWRAPSIVQRPVIGLSGSFLKIMEANPDLRLPPDLRTGARGTGVGICRWQVDSGRAQGLTYVIGPRAPSRPRFCCVALAAGGRRHERWHRADGCALAPGHAAP